MNKICFNVAGNKRKLRRRMVKAGSVGQFDRNKATNQEFHLQGVRIVTEMVFERVTR